MLPEEDQAQGGAERERQRASEHVDVEVEAEQGAPAVEELDAETRARRDEALRHVRKFGDPVLRAAAVPVERFDKAFKQEVERMGELMHDALGVGLAATQLGIMHRVLVYKAFADDPLGVLVNPQLQWSSEDSELGEEGCLSLPGVHVEVQRALRVRVRAQEQNGQEREVEADGLAARVIQHEMDHLDGVLILDRISREARREAMRAMREVSEGKRADEPLRRERHAGDGDDGDDGDASQGPEGELGGGDAKPVAGDDPRAVGDAGAGEARRAARASAAVQSGTP